jgi:hypothetical protein
MAPVEYRDMAPSPAKPAPAPPRGRPEWVWRDASSEGVVAPGSPLPDNKR